MNPKISLAIILQQVQTKQKVELFSKCAIKVLGTTKVTYQGQDIDLTPGWKRISMIDSIKEVTGIDFNEINTDEEAVALAKERSIGIPDKTKEEEQLLDEAIIDTYAIKGITNDNESIFYDEEQTKKNFLNEFVFTEENDNE